MDGQVHVVLDGFTQTGRIPAGDGSADVRSDSHFRIIPNPRRTLRLKLKPKAPVTGYVDGAWWPRSLDLSAELPALLAVLAVRLGRIQRVSYHLTGWDAVPRRIPVDGGVVRLGGFHAQTPHTIDVIGLVGPRITLLVVPPATGRAIAHTVLMTAGRRDNLDSVDELLDSATSDRPDLAVQRWEAEGGRVPQRV